MRCDEIPTVDILPEPFRYQEYQIEKVLTRHHTGVISPPGSGKSRVPIESLARAGLVSAGSLAPILVVCSGPAVATWKWQFPYWTAWPELSRHIYVVQGKPEYRKRLWNQARQGVGGIYIVNSNTFWRDFVHIAGTISNKKPGAHWAALIADEYHKYMRRRSQTFKKFATIARNIEYVVPLTGSVMSKDPSSMWTLFHLCDPKTFSSYWRFVHKFCIVDTEGFGTQIHGPRNVEQLKRLMDECLAFVPREVVADQLPGGNRRKIHVEMTPKQEKAYWAIAEEMVHELENGGLVVAPNVLSKLTMLRQLLCCPAIVDESLGLGGGFETILERLEDQPHAVIFVPFRPACDHIQKGLEHAGYTNVQVLRGGIGNEVQANLVNMFKKTRGIMICTIAYAESFDLETCDTSYFLGYEHNAEQNQQAEGRTQRAISQFQNVWWHYLVYPGTHDDDLLENVSQGYQNVRKVLSRPESMIRMLKGQK